MYTFRKSLIFDDWYNFINQSVEVEDFNTQLPFAGLGKDNLSIERDNNKIKIKTINIPKEGYLSRYYDLVYSYILTDKHDLDKIEATMENGLLKIHVPVIENDKAKKYDIKIS